MPGQKRTYSSKGRGGILSHDFSWERLGSSDSNNESRWPPKLKRPQKSSALLKKGLSKFSGPVSFSEDHDSDTGSVVEIPRKGKLKPVTNKRQKTSGSMPDLGDPMACEPTMKSSYGSASSHLPTPPIELQKQQKTTISPYFTNHIPSKSNLATQVTRSAWKRKSTPTSSDASFESKGSKESYIPKQYEAEKASAPRTNLLGGRLSSKSGEAKLQVDSACC